MMDDRDLIPRNESARKVNMNQFDLFYSYVRGEFHHVVVASMKALCHPYCA